MVNSGSKMVVSSGEKRNDEWAVGKGNKGDLDDALAVLNHARSILEALLLCDK